MIKDLEEGNNKDKIALVAVGYNRLQGLQRLLESLRHAFYDGMEVPLVISIDCSGNENLYSYVNQFEWPYGRKYVNIQSERLGLKKHIYQCGDLTQYFKAIALFEDDIWVSPYFYRYLNQVVDWYGNDDRICEIALYRNERLGGSGFYFDTLHDGSDCFLWQDVCTWGQCWTPKMWQSFRDWLEVHDDDYVNAVDMPLEVKQWTRAWSKYFIAYEVDTHKYVLFPHESLTTNFNDGGGEHGGGSNWVQVNVLHGYRNYQLSDVDKMVKYDIYTNNESLYDWLPDRYKNQTCLDLYGTRDSYGNMRYILSMKLLPFEYVEEWGIDMSPVELNIMYNIKGKGLRLYDTSKAIQCKTGRFKYYTDDAINFYIRGLNLNYIIRAIGNRLKYKILRKLGRI